MASPPFGPDSNYHSGAGGGRGSTRRIPRRVKALGIILAKVGIIALILILPSKLGISLAAGHGLALLGLLAVAVVTLLVKKLWGRTLPPTASHQPPRGHRFVLGSSWAKVARILKNQGRK